MSTSLAFAAEDSVGTLAHTSTADLSPEWTAAEATNDYQVNISNTGDDDSIRRVIIYQNPQYTNLDCQTKPDWTLSQISTFDPITGNTPTDACQYDTNTSNAIPAGSNEIFEFESTAPDGDTCELTWYFETQDSFSAQGERRIISDQTGVDSTIPTFSKEVNGPQINNATSVCPPGDDQVCYINQDTQIDVTVTDPGVSSSCQDEETVASGLDRCVREVWVDGEHYPDYDQEFNPEDGSPNEISFSTDFDEDSEHELKFTCYDNAGNELSDNETFRVDSTHPETTIHVDGPYKYNETTNTLWVDTESTISLDAFDPDTDVDGYTHSTGVKETRYEIKKVNDEYCLGGNAIQTESDGDTLSTQDHYDTYTGPFQMPEESCHRIKFLSEDNMGNIEPKNETYMYVDKTPPAIEKTVSNPKTPLLDFLGDERFETLFSDDNISTYWEADRAFPTGGVDSVSAFSRSDVLQISVDSTQTAPGTFQRTEGLTNVNATNYGTSMQVDLYVDPEWSDTATRAGFWVVGDDGADARDNLFGIIEFVNNEPCAESDCSNQANIQNHTGWRFWDSNTGWTTSDASFTYGEWATLSIVLDTDAEQYNYYVNGDHIGSAAGGEHFIREVFLNSYNYGEDSFPTLDSESYQAHWHGLTPVLDWYVSADTGITLMCEDQQPHPSGDETIHYSLERTTDGEIYTEVDGGSVQSTQHTIDFESPSQHRLTWYCSDAVNKTSEQDIEYFKADFEPPVINKTVSGPQTGECPPAPNSDEVCAISGETNVTVNVSDNESIHASHGVTCSYDVYWNDDTLESGTFGAEGKVFNWNEDSRHELSITCRDRVGNEIVDVEQFDVDLEPPTTTKHYGEPTVAADGYRWISSDTPITLSAIDEKSEVEDIYYNYTWVSDELCTEHATYFDYGMSDRWDSVADGEYPSTNEFNKDSQPPIRPGDAAPYVQLVDEGEGYVELQFVNNAPGLASFEYRIDGQEVGNTSHPVVTGDVIHPHVNVTSGTNTTQTFNASALVEVRLVLGGERDWDFEWTPFYVEPDSESFTSEGDYANFSIGQTSCHKITYYAVDSFGNQELTNFQYVNVDNEAPQINKTIGQPSIELAGTNGTLSEGCFTTGLEGQVTPSSLAGGIGVDETCEVEKSVTTGETAAADPEIYFLVDSTGSMSSPISDVKSNIQSILDSVDATYGAGDYKDFPTDAYAFSNEQTITSNKSLVESAINGMSATGGGDGSEGQFFALNEIANGAPGFSPDSSKIVVWFGDAPGHDPICTAISGEAENFTEESVTQALVDANIRVIAISTTSSSYVDGLDDDPTDSVYHYDSDCPIEGTPGQASRIANATGGVHLEDVDSSEIADAITDAIGDATSTTDIVPDASQCTALGVDVSFSPSSYTNVSALTTVEFNETVTRTAAAGDGTVVCDVHFRSGEGGGIIGTQEVTVGPAGNGSGAHYMVTQDTPITLACSDVQPHPVGDVELSYRSRFADDCADLGESDWGDWTNVTGLESLEHTFSFGEDSCHELEYVCTDALGNTQGSQYEIDIVDTVAPETNLTFLDQHHESSGMQFIDTNSSIELTAVDPEPHPSGVNRTEYKILGPLEDAACEGDLLVDSAVETEELESSWTTYTGPFGIDDESCHQVKYRSVDNLGNTESTQTESVFVDKSAPQIDKTYSPAAYVDENGSEYVNLETQAILDIYDVEPHPSGLDSAEYRVSLLDDEEACRSYEVCQGAEGSGDFSPVDGPVSFGEESCHLLEVRAEDNVGKTSTHKQCVFVDDTAPVTNKTVGEPREPMSLANQRLGASTAGYSELDPESDEYICDDGDDKCLEVTKLTNINMACEDPQPHPSGGETVHYKVGLDGEDVTERYCNDVAAGSFDSETGYCVVDDGASNFRFAEETWHRLEYFCEDNAGNIGESDVEYFKVEGTAFNLTLNEKWNLVSVPVALKNNALDDVMQGHEDTVVSTWTYDSGEWFVHTPDGDSTNDNLDTMKPGWGYWILTNESDSLRIGGTLFSPATTPPTKTIHKGWNLIGYYGAEGQLGTVAPQQTSPVGLFGRVRCELNTLYGLSISEPVNSMMTYWEPFNTAGSTPWVNMMPPDSPAPGAHEDGDRMNPGLGYWMSFRGDSGGYAPFSGDCGSADA